MNDNREVAVKKSRIIPENRYPQELDILLKLIVNDNVIQYIGTEVEKQYRYIALYPICDGTLMEAITNGEQKVVDSFCAGTNSCLIQLANGLNHIHNNNVQHRDIQPRNILIKYMYNKTLRFIITDFDLGHITGKPSLNKIKFGTIGWVPKEQWGKEERKPSVTIFSMGCVFYYGLTQGKHPFGKLTDMGECQDNIQAGKPPMLIDKELQAQLAHNFMKEQAKDLIKLMLTFNDEERPDASEVLDHPFFWDDQKVNELYKTMGDDIEADKYADLREYIRKNSDKVYRNDNWKANVPHKAICDSFRGKDQDDMCTLIKVVQDQNYTHMQC